MNHNAWNYKGKVAYAKFGIQDKCTYTYDGKV